MTARITRLVLGANNVNKLTRTLGTNIEPDSQHVRRDRFLMGRAMGRVLSPSMFQERLERTPLPGRT